MLDSVVNHSDDPVHFLRAASEVSAVHVSWGARRCRARSQLPRAHRPNTHASFRWVHSAKYEDKQFLAPVLVILCYYLGSCCIVAVAFGMLIPVIIAVLFWSVDCPCPIPLPWCFSISSASRDSTVRWCLDALFCRNSHVEESGVTGQESHAQHRHGQTRQRSSSRCRCSTGVFIQLQYCWNGVAVLLLLDRTVWHHVRKRPLPDQCFCESTLLHPSLCGVGNYGLHYLL